MSQNFSRGLENEYLVPYISFTTHPQSGSIVGGGTTTLTAVAAASTGIGYLNYRWYQDDVLSGGITTALSGVTTTRSYTLNYAGDNLSRVVNYKVSAEWVPDNSDLIVSHGTPGVGATGVGVGQSISGYSPSGETFSNVGVVSVAPGITVNIVAVGVQPLGFNTSSYNLSRTLSVSATISNGDNGNLSYQWKNAGTNVSGATSSSYTFSAGHVGLNTYTCLVSYPTDELVSSVTSDSITDNSTELTKTIRLEYMPAGGEKVSSSTDYDVYSEDVDLSDYTNGFKIDLNHVQEIINTAGSRNTSVYAWENYYYVSMFSKDDDLTVDLELGGAKGAESGAGIDKFGGDGGWMVLQGTMEKEKEFVGIAATGLKTTRRPATAVYETGSVVGIVGNGGRGGSTGLGGDGGADSAGGGSGQGQGGGGYFSTNTLPAEGTAPTATVKGTASRCPKGSSWYQNRYGACETFTSKLRDPDGVEYPVATNSNNTEITRGFKVTNLYLDNGAHDTVDTTNGTGGAGADGGGRNVQTGGGGGSGYYGGSWTKKAAVLGGNDGASRTWTYGTNLTQTVTTDGNNGYIRVFGRRGSAGNNPLVTSKNASIVRNPASLTRSGLFLDLTSWASTEEVLIRGKVDVTNTNSSVIQYLTSGGTFSYAFQGNSDEYLTNMGTTVMTVDKNSGTVDQWLTGGAYYQFRTTNEDTPENGSGIYQGGENQGGNAGVASGGEFNITLHDTGSSGGPNNTGDNADLRVTWSIQGER
jgi:hypothetical protein